MQFLWPEVRRNQIKEDYWWFQVCIETTKRSPIGWWHLKLPSVCLHFIHLLSKALSTVEGSYLVVTANTPVNSVARWLEEITGKSSSLWQYGVAALHEWFPVYWRNVLPSSLRAQHSWTCTLDIEGSKFLQNTGKHPAAQLHILGVWNPRLHSCGNLELVDTGKLLEGKCNKSREMLRVTLVCCLGYL